MRLSIFKIPCSYNLLLCSVFIFSFSKVEAQFKHWSENLQEAHIIGAEKIYLQLDNNSYATGETIWFKAIVTEVRTHIPTALSNILYVELIEPKNQKIIDRKILKIENGIADNAFDLNQDYASGRYLIRAYTEWNKNFGQDFVFSTYVNLFKPSLDAKKSIPIKNVIATKIDTTDYQITADVLPLELDDLHQGKPLLYINYKSTVDTLKLKKTKSNQFQLNHILPSDVPIAKYVLKTKNKEYAKSVVIDKERMSLQFFPEGGKMVNGLESILGFKALDYKGKGKPVQGEIIDDQENVIVAFSSNKLGMGKIAFVPDYSKTYFGRITNFNGDVLKYPLPKAVLWGSVLAVSQDSMAINIHLKSNNLINNLVYIHTKQRGKIDNIIKTRFVNGKVKYRLAKTNLPEGINEITIYNSEQQPICERLFYVSKDNETIRISVNSDLDDLVQRDRTDLNLEIEYQGKPVAAKLSILVVDSTYFNDTKPMSKNIVTHFLLESDLRGKVETPSFYFTNDTNKKELDALLLTQGWRNYKYDATEIATKFLAEKNLKISGYVGGVQNVKRGPKKYNLTMMTFGDGNRVYHQEIDKTGRFEFILPESYGNGKEMVIQCSTLDGKKKEVTIRLDEQKQLKVNYNKIQNIVPLDSIIEQQIKQSSYGDDVDNPLLLSDNTIQLDEVTLRNYELTPNRKKIKDEHGDPDTVWEAKELEKKITPWTNSLFELLAVNYRDELRIHKVGGPIGFLKADVVGAGFTYVVIDGNPVALINYNLLEQIVTTEVKSVEILKTASANRYSSTVFQGPIYPPPPSPAILAIYTYNKRGLFGALNETKGIYKHTLPEFAAKKEFYTPDYSIEDQNDNGFIDVRKLVHWQPNISIDESGRKTLHFYNDDTLGKKKIIIEAISSQGKVGYKEVTYEVVSRN